MISLWINQAVWSRDLERGHIRDITFKNIQAVSPNLPRRTELKGFDAGHTIDGVTFDHVVVNGRPLTAGDISANEFVRQVTVKP